MAQGALPTGVDLAMSPGQHIAVPGVETQCELLTDKAMERMRQEWVIAGLDGKLHLWMRLRATRLVGEWRGRSLIEGHAEEAAALHAAVTRITNTLGDTKGDLDAAHRRVEHAHAEAEVAMETARNVELARQALEGRNAGLEEALAVARREVKRVETELEDISYKAREAGREAGVQQQHARVMLGLAEREAGRAREEALAHLGSWLSQVDGMARLVGELARGHAHEAVMKAAADHALTKEMEAERLMGELRAEYAEQDSVMTGLNARLVELQADEEDRHRDILALLVEEKNKMLWLQQEQLQKEEASREQHEGMESDYNRVLLKAAIAGLTHRREREVRESKFLKAKKEWKKEKKLHGKILMQRVQRWRNQVRRQQAVGNWRENRMNAWLLSLKEAVVKQLHTAKDQHDNDKSRWGTIRGELQETIDRQLEELALYQEAQDGNPHTIITAVRLPKAGESTAQELAVDGDISLHQLKLEVTSSLYSNYSTYVHIW